LFTASLFTPGGQTISVNDIVKPAVNGTSTTIFVVAPTPTSTPTPAECVQFTAQWGSPGTGNGQFQGPTGITVDKVVDVYVVDSQNNRIQKFDSNGNFLLTWGSAGSGQGQFYFPTGAGTAIIGLNSTGNIYVADTANNRVEVFNTNGGFLFQFGATGSGNGQFSQPNAVGIDSLDNVYVTDSGNSRVEKFDINGNFILAWGSAGTGPGQFSLSGSGSGGMGVDSLNHLFISDAGNNRVQEFDNIGGFIRQFGSVGSGNGQFRSPQGIAIDPLRNLYVADSVNHRVEIFDLLGNYLSQFGSYGSAGGQFVQPEGVAADKNLNIYVTDFNNHRVEKFHLCQPTPSLTSGFQGDVVRASSLLTGGNSYTSTPTPTATLTPTVTPVETSTVTSTPTSSVLLQSAVAAPNISRNGQPIIFMINLGGNAMVQLNLYSLMGEEVYSDTIYGNAGINNITWLLRNKTQIPVASGIYIFTIQVNNGYETVTKTGKVLVFH